MRAKCESAINELRNMITDSIKYGGHVDKVIVGGDFNELGELIKNDKKKWKPLPEDIPHARGSINVKETLKTLTADHIWVGGQDIDPQTCTFKKGDTFGS